MAEDVYKLGNWVAYIHKDGLMVKNAIHRNFIIENVEPHELRKLATVLEEAKRAKDFPEDYEQKKFTDNDDVTGYIK